MKRLHNQQGTVKQFMIVKWEFFRLLCMYEKVKRFCLTNRKQVTGSLKNHKQQNYSSMPTELTLKQI